MPIVSKSNLTILAKNLRRNQTKPELKLWWAIRSRQIRGAKFKRQFAIPPYIVDFACIAAHLVIEVDGGQHSLEINARDDLLRTRYLESKGLTAIRFTNLDILIISRELFTRLKSTSVRTVFIPPLNLTFSPGEKE